MNPDLHLWMLRSSLRRISGERPAWPQIPEGAGHSGRARRFAHPAASSRIDCYEIQLPHSPARREPGHMDPRRRLPRDFSFQLDQLTLVMLCVVTGVGFLIHIYSAGYMAEETVTGASSPT